MDASQSISFTAYDAATGAVNEQIQDVNFTNNCSDQQFQSEPGADSGILAPTDHRPEPHYQELRRFPGPDD